jgi:chromosomal replication initiation ATPase DnaA
VSDNVWESLLAHLRSELDPEDFRRWFAATALATDAGDQVTIWVPTESIRRHIHVHYLESLERALRQLGRDDTDLRFVVAGYGDDEDDAE